MELQSSYLFDTKIDFHNRELKIGYLELFFRDMADKWNLVSVY